MIRFLLRFIGLICLAAAFILVIYDGTKSIAANNFYFTSARTLWELLNAGGLLWDPLMVGILAAPSWALLGGFGILLLVLGRRKKPLIGYVR